MGFPHDLVLSKSRTVASISGVVNDRLRGAQRPLITTGTEAEVIEADDSEGDEEKVEAEGFATGADAFDAK